MVYNENLDVRTVEEVNLYEPRIGKIRTKLLCYPIALLFFMDDIVHFYLTHINYYEREDPFYSNLDIPVNFALRFVTILAAISLIYGIWKEKSTPIAVFLWTLFEINILFVTFYCYKSIYGLLDSSERIKEYILLFIKALLWWIVNSYHNYIKEREFILHGTVRRSTAFTDVKKYKLVESA